MSQNTYVESIPTVNIPLGWARSHKKQLEVKQIAEMREVNGKVLYAARKTRPDVAATASLVSATMPTPTVADALALNRCVKHLREIAGAELIIWSIPLDRWRWLTFSDADWAKARKHGPQGGWLICLTVPEMFNGEHCPGACCSGARSGFLESRLRAWAPRHRR